MDGRKRESGAKYKKLRDEKEERESELLKKIPKIEKFFTPKPKQKADNTDTGMLKFCELFFDHFDVQIL